MEDIIHITYGDLDNKTILENIDGKLEVQTDETIGRTASGALTVIQGGVDITMKEDKGVVSRVVRLLTTEDLNTIVGETIHCRQADSNNIVSGMNYPVMEAGYLECMYSGADNCTHQRYTTYMTDILFTRRFTDTNGWSAWKEIGTGAGLGELASGGNIDGDVYVRGQVHSIKDIGDAYIGVEDETNTDAMFMSLNDTHMTLYNKTDVVEGNIVQVDRATGEVSSDYFENKGVVSGRVQLLTDENLNDLPFDSTKSYRQVSNVLATPENNYPVSMAGYLEVLHGDSNIAFQRYTALNGLAPPYMYIRQYYDDEFSEGGWSDWVQIISGMGGVIDNHSLYIAHTSGLLMYQIAGADNDHIKMHMGDATFGLFQSVNGTAYDIVSTYRDTGAINSSIFQVIASVFISNIQSYSPEELSLHEEEIQEKIIDLEIRLERANAKQFTKLATTIQSQLDILNAKLNEVINND